MFWSQQSSSTSTIQVSISAIFQQSIYNPLRKSIWGQEKLHNLVTSDEFDLMSVEDLQSKLETMMDNRCSNWPDPQIIKQSGGKVE